MQIKVKTHIYYFKYIYIKGMKKSKKRIKRVERMEDMENERKKK